MKKKLLFIDRDGTLIEEPKDEQVDSLEKLVFYPGIFKALSQITEQGMPLCTCFCCTISVKSMSWESRVACKTLLRDRDGANKTEIFNREN